MKTVSFKDQEFEAPDWASYITADPDGSVWVFSGAPIKRQDDYYDTSSWEDTCEQVGYIDDANCKWVG